MTCIVCVLFLADRQDRNAASHRYMTCRRWGSSIGFASHRKVRYMVAEPGYPAPYLCGACDVDGGSAVVPGAGGFDDADPGAGGTLRGRAEAMGCGG